jgi:hypothetical protein
MWTKITRPKCAAMLAAAVVAHATVYAVAADFSLASKPAKPI